ncbi:MAG TPA: AraC family transcriptional regulator [Steroidobacteraceae bacterium]|nr:AraC family transcriptional regulator [Steroidobacteraceae bacterium]
MAASRRSQAEYEKRMHAVVEHIDRHLDQKLDLETLAGVAHFSPFHFHRLFGALMGEPLGDYLRRRRLELAAVRLRAQHRVPVLDVALGVGFGSAEAFTRAFRTRFGCSPTQWRKRKPGQVPRKADQAARGLKRKNVTSRTKETHMKVRIIEREPVHVAYLRHIGPYGAGIGVFWMKTVAPWMATNNLMGRGRFGISLDDPTVTRPAQCRYDACVASPEGEVLSGNPQHKVIPGGKYAALAFEGTSAEIGAAWDALLRDWLPKSGLQLDARPFFEYYPVDGRYDPKSGAFSCDICVPVAPLTSRA